MNSIFNNQASSYLAGEMPQEIFDGLLKTDNGFKKWIAVKEAIDLTEKALSEHKEDDHVINEMLKFGAKFTHKSCVFFVRFAGVKTVNMTGGRLLIEAWLLKAKGMIDVG